MIPWRSRFGSFREDKRNPLWRMSGMGIELASHIVAGLLIGWLLDYWLKTSPLWLVIGTVAGVVVGMVQFIRSALKAQRQSTRQAAARRLEKAAPDAKQPPPQEKQGESGNEHDRHD